MHIYAANTTFLSRFLYTRAKPEAQRSRMSTLWQTPALTAHTACVHTSTRVVKSHDEVPVPSWDIQ